ncbi:mechanosensitive ion channel family protein [Alkalilimnicola sp. S0819]|uniref:mechanosensitive ion channel family protein n=1 Tax=Alkalilimnicola sp. S0819 TaxID=2613922 RepID=UPI001262679C|nr:mechanosensitive ion channel family protein [Alkalilimnicola sp. S0819]KAB7627454.1 mechanosensitive ion channel family protein [Alkalilimnicola sp. S0819]MPQ15603.1 mechanosensitive ion channel [Alkalilimnicola sp. S0819]
MWKDLQDFLSRSLGLEGQGMLVVQLAVVLFVAVLVNFMAGLALRRLQAKFQRKGFRWGDAVVQALRSPLYWLIWILGVAFAVEVLQRTLAVPAAIFDYVAPARQIAVIAMMAWFLLRLVRGVEENIITRRRERGEPLDYTTVDAMGKLVRLAITIIALLVALQTLGFSISGVLAFGGIGGIAVGFAAKDLLSNFFGGLTIYLDRPFSVGDWVRSPDRNIEGTVENIGWRLTTIRTFDQRPLYVPNSVFNSIALENPSRMYNRRINETIGIRYDDWEQMESIVTAVRQMLIDHEDMETEQRTLIVAFNSFGASSLDFFIYTFTKTVDWVKYHTVKQDVLLRIMRIIDEHGAEIAFPTSTVHVPEALRMLGDAQIGENGSVPREARG